MDESGTIGREPELEPEQGRDRESTQPMVRSSAGIARGVRYLTTRRYGGSSRLPDLRRRSACAAASPRIPPEAGRPPTRSVCGDSFGRLSAASEKQPTRRFARRRHDRALALGPSRGERDFSELARRLRRLDLALRGDLGGHVVRPEHSLHVLAVERLADEGVDGRPRKPAPKRTPVERERAGDPLVVDLQIGDGDRHVEADLEHELRLLLEVGGTTTSGLRGSRWMNTLGPCKRAIATSFLRGKGWVGVLISNSLGADIAPELPSARSRVWYSGRPSRMDRNSAFSAFCQAREPAFRARAASPRCDLPRANSRDVVLEMIVACPGESHSPVVHELWVLVVAGSNPASRLRFPLNQLLQN